MKKLYNNLQINGSDEEKEINKDLEISGASDTVINSSMDSKELNTAVSLCEKLMEDYNISGPIKGPAYYYLYASSYSEEELRENLVKNNQDIQQCIDRDYYKTLESIDIIMREYTLLYKLNKDVYDEIYKKSENNKLQDQQCDSEEDVGGNVSVGRSIPYVAITSIDSNDSERRFNVKKIMGFAVAVIIIIVLVKNFWRFNFYSNNQNSTRGVNSKIEQSDSNQATLISKSQESNGYSQSGSKENNTAAYSNSKEYILPGSDVRIISEEELKSLDKWQLQLARNEIVARHGYVFNTPELKTYFEAKRWYRPNPAYKGDITSDVENYNVQLIKKAEANIASSHKAENRTSQASVYLTKLDNIEVGLKDIEKKLSNGTTADMREAVGEMHKRWDAALNEIYGVLRQQLSSEDMKKLKSEQLKWITDRDAKAKEASLSMKGGTMESVIYTSSLADITKNRCYELVEKYMQ